jgi:hypothetical protein
MTFRITAYTTTTLNTMAFSIPINKTRYSIIAPQCIENKPFMLCMENVVRLNVVMLNVIMLGVVVHLASKDNKPRAKFIRLKNSFFKPKKIGIKKFQKL